MIEQALIRGAVAFAIAGLLTLFLRGRPAAVRHSIWSAAIIVQLALLGLVRVLPAIDMPVLPALTVTVDQPLEDVTRDRTGTETPAPGSTTSPSPASATNPVAAAQPGITFRQAVFYIWLAGAALIFLRYLIGTILMARLAHAGRRVDEAEWLTLTQRMARELNITRPVTLLWGDKLAVPITWGIIYPMVLLPESAAEWSPERRRFVLVHELAHVRRFDALTQLIAQVTLAVFWCSPFVWLAEWRLRVEREHACDDVVLQHGTEATLYADELLQMVRSLMSRQAARPAFAALAMARRSEFEGRMLAILDPHRRRAQASRGLIVAVISLALAVPLAALNPIAFNAITQQPEVTKAPAPFPLAATTCDLDVATIHQGLDITARNEDTWQVVMKREEPGRCLLSHVRGAITLNDDETQVRALGDNSFVELREVTRGRDVSARIEASPNGPVTSFIVNGKATVDDGPAQQWIARVLPQVMSEAAYHTDARIKRLLAAYALRGTLDTIARIHSTSSLAYHYLALIEARRWNAAELGQIRKAAAGTLKGYPSDLDRVLRALPDRQVRAEAAAATTTNDWLEQILASLSSDSELRSVLTTHIGNADKPKLLMLARAAGRMSSGQELSSYLITATSYMLTKRDRDLENAWFALANQLRSSHERRQALIAAISYSYGNPHVQNLIAQSASGMESDTDKIAVLTALAAVR